MTQRTVVSPKRLDLRELKLRDGMDLFAATMVSPKRLDLRELKQVPAASWSALPVGLTQTTRLERTETRHHPKLQQDFCPVSPKRLDLRELKLNVKRILHFCSKVSPKRLDLRELKRQGSPACLKQSCVSPKRLDLRELKPQAWGARQMG